MSRCVIYLLLCALGPAFPLAAQSIDSKKRVVGVFLGATLVGKHRQVTIDPGRNPVGSAGRDLKENGDVYLVSVRIGNKTYTGRYFEPLLARVNSSLPRTWPQNSRVGARFEKGGETKVRMYIRPKKGYEILTELMSIVDPKGHERCLGDRNHRNCAAGWQDP